MIPVKLTAFTDLKVCSNQQYEVLDLSSRVWDFKLSKESLYIKVPKDNTLFLPRTIKLSEYYFYDNTGVFKAPADFDLYYELREFILYHETEVVFKMIASMVRTHAKLNSYPNA